MLLPAAPAALASLPPSPPPFPPALTASAQPPAHSPSPLRAPLHPFPTPTPRPTATPTPTPEPFPTATPILPEAPTSPPPPTHAPISTPIPIPEILPTATPIITTVLEDVPRFLSLPFAPDPQMALLQGWFYDGGGLQSGIDYYRYHNAETITRTNTFSRFPVVAAANGEACGQRDDAETGYLAHTMPTTRCVRGYGHRVFIRHSVQGKTYYTYYGHLDTIADHIPLGDRTRTVYVKRGTFLGYAGNTGTSGGNIHLHFGLLSPVTGWIDPYDIRKTHEFYPDPNSQNGLRSGFNDYWQTNPPSYATEVFWPPEGEVLSPAPGQPVGGTIQVEGHASVRESEINKIEIWIDGRLHRTAAHSLPREESGTTDGFVWGWDTTLEHNGPHLLQVRAIAENGSRALLPVPSASSTYSTSMLVNIQNPYGYIDHPLHDTPLRGKQMIQGWVKANDIPITSVEIWVDGAFRGQAAYGQPRADLGGDYGFAWEWDTRRENHGSHTIQVRAWAENGGWTMLRYGEGEPVSKLVVNVDNLPLPFAPGAWSVR